MAKKVLITGITGLIGNYIYRQLSQQNAYSLKGQYVTKRNIDSYLAHDVKMMQADICEPKQIIGICKDIDIVIHAAARVLDYGTKEEFYAAHYHATAYLLEDAKKNKIKQFIYISSFGVASSLSRKGMLPNEDTPLKKSGIIYDDVKIDAEKLVIDFCQKNNIHYTIIRPSAVIGEGSVWVVEPLKRIAKKPGMFLIDGGRHDACLIDAANLADGIIRCIDNPNAYNETFFFCDDWHISWQKYLNDLAAIKGLQIERNIPFYIAYPIATVVEKVFPLLGKKPPIARKSAKATGSDRRVDCSKAKNVLAWKSTVSYEQSMARIAKWVKDNNL